MLWQRVVAAIVGIPVLLASLYMGEYILLVLVIILNVLGLAEFRMIVSKSGYRAINLILLLFALAVPVIFQVTVNNMGITILSLLVFGCSYYVLKYPEYSPLDFALTLFGIIYIVIGFSHLILLRNMAEGFWLAAYVFLVVWSTDTAAYFVGLNFGRHKLLTLVSPQKSWEGFCGGILGSFLLIFLLAKFLVPTYEQFLLYMTPLVSAAAQIGDLFESTLKRYAGVKDSGKIIPGHGGVLDRFDSALWAIPLTYHLLSLFERLY